MKQFVLIYISVALLFFNFSEKAEDVTIEAFTQQQFSSCSPACQFIDSLALVAIYNNMGGPSWTAGWDLNTPVCGWTGIDLDANGFVEELILNNNGLTGSIPVDIGLLSRVEKIQIDNNDISGTIPPIIGSLPDLRVLFIDNNQLTGTVPDEFGNLSKLQTFYLDNNMLEGAIPNSMTGITGLLQLQFYHNNIDSLPDFSVVPNMQVNRFRFYNNKLTFDDILPNIGPPVGQYYEPQDSICDSINLIKLTGTYHTFDLDIDDGITDNVYQWYKDGVTFGTPTNSNQLTIGPLDYADSGKYTCEVTNPGAPLLTLYCRPTTLNVLCGPIVNAITDTLCSTETLTIEGTTYHPGNSSGLQLLSVQNQYGCDSIVDVDLTFVNPAEIDYEPLLCPGTIVNINGTEYGPSNPTGTEVFPLGGTCDSTVNISLSFLATLPNSSFTPTVCRTEEVIVNGTIYNFASPTGIEILDDASAAGCDSIISVALNFYPLAEEDIQLTLCDGEEMLINGTTYNQGNPFGTETIGGAALNGCDSIINIDLSYYLPIEENHSPTLCPGEEQIINGNTYNESSPTGTEVFTAMAANGCDSTVNVSLNYFTPVVFDYSITLCPGEEEVINGTLYNKANPTGTEIYSAMAANGCDSMVNVALTYYSPIVVDHQPTLCPGEEQIVNGNIYNESNPTGQEVFTGMAANGCDSTVLIALNYYNPISSTYDPTFCSDQDVIVNGTTYNQGNPMGTEVLTALNGCDSIVTVALQYASVAEGNYAPTLCSGASIVLNGNTYDVLNPTGDELLVGQGNGGCDSLVHIDLSFHLPKAGALDTSICETASIELNGETFDINNSFGTQILGPIAEFGCDSTLKVIVNFFPQVIGNYSNVLCEGEQEIINGTIYDISNTFGVETLSGSSSNGCDSLVQVNISFYNPIETDYTPSLCTGGSVEVNGVPYDQNNPSGTEIFTASNGCDSIVNVSLSFGNSIMENYNPDLCSGESIEINGTTYDINNQTGTEAFPGMGSGGCDSIVMVDINILLPVSSIFQEDICPGDVFTINGQDYGENNLVGQEIFSGLGSNGCDSIVNIQLSIQSPDTFLLDSTICESSNIMVNGTIYDDNNPSGFESFTLASGCDSIVEVSLSFTSTVSYEMEEVFCDSSTLTIGTTTFGPDNPSGSVLLQGQSQNGCDSLVNVNLTYLLNDTTYFEDTLCLGGQISINGNIYDEVNPMGTEILEGATQEGCDSIIVINLSFFPEIIDTFYGPICNGEVFQINGNIYDPSNSTGVEVLVGASEAGCDSTVVLDLTFLGPITHQFDAVFCTGASIEVNGTLYDANNPSGQELLVGQSYHGCDSLINVNLSFSEVLYWDIDTTLCEGIDFQMGDTVITEPGQYDLVLSGANGGGCDTVINLQLSFEVGEDYGPADAGPDITLCIDEAMLDGITVPGQSGFWTSEGLAILDHINQANTAISNLQPGPNPFTWSVSSVACENYDQDEIIITYLPLPVPFEDSFALDFKVSTFHLDFLANDSFPWPETPFTVTAEIDTGGLIIQENDTTLLFAPQPSFVGTIEGTYTICGTLCPDDCYEQLFVIDLTNEFWDRPDQWNPPNGITPNGDGANDAFVLDALIDNPDKYANNELVIFNRYGSIVYQARPYLNDWDGRSLAGSELPEGTYYYVLRLDIGSGEIYKGDITVIR